MSTYYAPQGGLPPQTALMTQRAVFTDAYAVIPKGCFSDIVTSYLPGWRGLRMWLIARPMSGFSETFSQYVCEVQPGGGSDAPDNDPGAQSVLFVTHGLITLTINGAAHDLDAGGYAYIPAGARWSLLAEGAEPARFHWLRKIWEPAEGIAARTTTVPDRTAPGRQESLFRAPAIWESAGDDRTGSRIRAAPPAP